tara:strand:+ start:140 stop:319 length:180 start_codon:yes stop_codon:yes gene_type:complete
MSSYKQWIIWENKDNNECTKLIKSNGILILKQINGGGDISEIYLNGTDINKINKIVEGI